MNLNVEEKPTKSIEDVSETPKDESSFYIHWSGNMSKKQENEILDVLGCFTLPEHLKQEILKQYKASPEGNGITPTPAEEDLPNFGKLTEEDFDVLAKSKNVMDFCTKLRGMFGRLDKEQRDLCLQKLEDAFSLGLFDESSTNQVEDASSLGLAAEF